MSSATATADTIGPAQKSDASAVLLGLMPTLLAFSWLVSKAQWYWNHHPDMQFGWIVLMLCAVVIWDQWSKRPGPVWRVNLLFVVCGLTGLGILFVMQLYQAA